MKLQEKRPRKHNCGLVIRINQIKLIEGGVTAAKIARRARCEIKTLTRNLGT